MTCPLNRLETMIARGVNLRARSNLVLTLRDIKLSRTPENPRRLACQSLTDRQTLPARDSSSPVREVLRPRDYSALRLI